MKILYITDRQSGRRPLKTKLLANRCDCCLISSMASPALYRCAAPVVSTRPLIVRFLSHRPKNPSVCSPTSTTTAARRCDHSVRASKSEHLPSSCANSVVITKGEKFGNKQIICVTPQLYDYILANVREPEILRELREETATMRGSQMQVSPDQAQLLAMLVQMLGAERCIEVGVYTGYSSLAIALVLPESGCLIACERDAKSLEIARRYYEQAGVLHKVDVKHELAVDTLKSLILNGEACSYDFAFVDAEKRMYHEYFELLLQLLRIGGVIVFDNVLWHGKIADPLANDPKTLSIRKFNEDLMKDKRVNICMVPIGDGITICRKR